MNYPGVLSDTDINKSIEDKEIVITPFNQDNITPVGYNLTSTDFIFSINNGLLVEIICKNNERFCWVEPNNTVLVLTREAVWVSRQICGTFHSKVGKVSDGFGHIGTTLDPHWEGPLLISVNNPTKKKLKFLISENKTFGVKYSSFVTLLFYRMISPAEKAHDNPPSRIDVLRGILDKAKYPAFLNWKNYKSLQNVIDKICNFESAQVNIGKYSENEKNKKIAEFIEKYTKYAEEVNFNIEQAHRIKDQIVLYNKIIYGIIIFVLIIGLGGELYLLYKAYLADNSNLLAFLAVVIAVSTQAFAWIRRELKSKLL